MFTLGGEKCDDNSLTDGQKSDINEILGRYVISYWHLGMLWTWSPACGLCLYRAARSRSVDCTQSAR